MLLGRGSCLSSCRAVLMLDAVVGGSVMRKQLRVIVVVVTASTVVVAVFC